MQMGKREVHVTAHEMGKCVCFMCMLFGGLAVFCTIC